MFSVFVIKKDGEEFGSETNKLIIDSEKDLFIVDGFLEDVKCKLSDIERIDVEIIEE